jgi:hypothetical protein
MGFQKSAQSKQSPDGFSKVPKVNSRPKGENSHNVVTLVVISNRRNLVEISFSNEKQKDFSMRTRCCNSRPTEKIISR